MYVYIYIYIYIYMYIHIKQTTYKQTVAPVQLAQPLLHARAAVRAVPRRAIYLYMVCCIGVYVYIYIYIYIYRERERYI